MFRVPKRSVLSLGAARVRVQPLSKCMKRTLTRTCAAYKKTIVCAGAMKLRSGRAGVGGLMASACPRLRVNDCTLGLFES